MLIFFPLIGILTNQMSSEIYLTWKGLMWSVKIPTCEKKIGIGLPCLNAALVTDCDCAASPLGRPTTSQLLYRCFFISSIPPMNDWVHLSMCAVKTVTVSQFQDWHVDRLMLFVRCFTVHSFNCIDFLPPDPLLVLSLRGLWVIKKFKKQTVSDCAQRNAVIYNLNEMSENESKVTNWVWTPACYVLSRWTKA